MDTVAIFLNLVGTCLLALGASHYLKWIGLVLEAHQMFLEQSTSGGNATLVTGVEKHLQSAKTRDRFVILAGLGLNIAGIILQIIQTT
jgi:hypothetical protein